jgi:hypothetical protein
VDEEEGHNGGGENDDPPPCGPNTTSICVDSQNGLCVPGLGCSGYNNPEFERMLAERNARALASFLEGTATFGEFIGGGLDAFENWSGIKVPGKIGFGLDFFIQIARDIDRDDLSPYQIIGRGVVNGVEGGLISSASSAVGTMLGEAALQASFVPAVASEQLWLPPVAYWGSFGAGYLGTNYTLGAIADFANQSIIYPLFNLGAP